MKLRGLQSNVLSIWQKLSNPQDTYLEWTSHQLSIYAGSAVKQVVCVKNAVTVKRTALLVELLPRALNCCDRFLCHHHTSVSKNGSTPTSVFDWKRVTLYDNIVCSRRTATFDRCDCRLVARMVPKEVFFIELAPSFLTRQSIKGS